MNILENSNHAVKKQNIDYFRHLVRVAMADDVITNTELELLNRLGKKLGFTNEEIDQLIQTTNKSDYIPPYELSERFGQVFDIIRMTLVDGVIDNKEMQLASNFATKSGFSDEEIPKLLVLLISGIRLGKDEEELFEQYKKERRLK